MSEHQVRVATLSDLVNKIKQWLAYMRHKLVIIIIVSLLGAIIGITVAFLSKPVYSAVVSFSIEDEKTSSGGALSGLASQLGFDMGGSTGSLFSGSNLMELFKSKSIVEKTLTAPIVINGKNDSLIKFYLGFAKLKYSEKQPYHVILSEVVRKNINENIWVNKNSKAPGIQVIEIRSENEVYAKLFAEEIVKQVANMYVQTKTEKLTKNIAILQKQVDSIRVRLNESITGVGVSNDNAFNLNPAFSVKKIGTTRNQIEVQFSSSVLSELIKNLELTKFKLLDQTPLIKVIDAPVLPLTRTSRSKLLYFFAGGFVGLLLSITVLHFYRILELEKSHKI